MSVTRVAVKGQTRCLHLLNTAWVPKAWLSLGLARPPEPRHGMDEAGVPGSHHLQDQTIMVNNEQNGKVPTSLHVVITRPAATFMIVI